MFCLFTFSVHLTISLDRSRFVPSSFTELHLLESSSLFQCLFFMGVISERRVNWFAGFLPKGQTNQTNMNIKVKPSKSIRIATESKQNEIERERDNKKK